MEFDTYNVAALVFEELRRQLWPLRTNVNVHPPWVGLTDEEQRIWERAIQQAFTRCGIIPTPPGKAVHEFVVHRPREFKRPKEGDS